MTATPVEILMQLVFTATMDSGRRYRQYPVGYFVAKVNEETKEILKRLKSDDIAPGKMSDLAVDIGNEKFYEDKRYSEMLRKFDKKILNRP